MNSLIVDYFAAEAAIVARLEALGDFKAVLTPFDVADMVESSQPSPAVHVIYSGDTIVGNEAGEGRQNMVAQKWLVIVAARLPKAQLQQTIKIRALAGQLVPKVLGALQGWAPVEWMRPLSRVNGPPAGYSSSFAYFPFMFQGRIVT